MTTESNSSVGANAEDKDVEDWLESAFDIVVVWYDDYLDVRSNDDDGLEVGDVVDGGMDEGVLDIVMICLLEFVEVLSKII